MSKKEYYPRKEKYPRLEIIHRRPTKYHRPLKKGGMTIVTLRLRKGVAIVGAAFCWKLENYNKVKGKSIALGRLLYALSILDNRDYVETKEWIFKQIGKIDKKLMYDAFHGVKIK